MCRHSSNQLCFDFMGQISHQYKHRQLLNVGCVNTEHWKTCKEYAKRLGSHVSSAVVFFVVCVSELQVCTSVWATIHKQNKTCALGKFTQNPRMHWGSCKFVWRCYQVLVWFSLLDHHCTLAFSLTQWCNWTWGPHLNVFYRTPVVNLKVSQQIFRSFYCEVAKRDWLNV